MGETATVGQADKAAGGETGKAAVFLGPSKGYELREFPVPDPEAGGITIKVTMGGICGSDLHIWRGDSPVFAAMAGQVVGHEMTGRVAKLGANIKTDSLGQPLKEGDRVLRVDDKPVADAQQLFEWIRASVDGQTARPMLWRIERAGQVMDIRVVPRVAREGEKSIARIDAQVGQAPARVTVQLGFVEGLERGAARTWEVSVMTLRMLGRMLIGQASIRNLSGPLTIADYAGQSVNLGLAYYLGFLALVMASVNIFGGFLVTQRMLGMYKKKEAKK